VGNRYIPGGSAVLRRQSSMEHLQGRKESSDQRKIKPDSNGPCRNLRKIAISLIEGRGAMSVIAPVLANQFVLTSTPEHTGAYRAHRPGCGPQQPRVRDRSPDCDGRGTESKGRVGLAMRANPRLRRKDRISTPLRLLCRKCYKTNRRSVASSRGTSQHGFMDLGVSGAVAPHGNHNMPLLKLKICDPCDSRHIPPSCDRAAEV
jgi:hypothetical protein